MNIMWKIANTSLVIGLVFGIIGFFWGMTDEFAFDDRELFIKYSLCLLICAVLSGIPILAYLMKWLILLIIKIWA